MFIDQIVMSKLFKTQSFYWIAPMFLLCSCSFSSRENAGDHIFKSNQVHEVNILFDEKNYFSLLTENKRISDSIKSNLFLCESVIIDGVRLDSVAVRFKGKSTYGHPGSKKSLKLSFEKCRKGKEFDGLHAIILNNNNTGAVDI